MVYFNAVTVEPPLPDHAEGLTVWIIEGSRNTDIFGIQTVKKHKMWSS